MCAAWSYAILKDVKKLPGYKEQCTLFFVISQGGELYGIIAFRSKSRGRISSRSFLAVSS